ncbi:MAG: cytochrome b559 subunit alpha [Cyanobacteria bacterium P01_F01_bin.143]
MAGTTGERPLGDIVTDIEFWKLHFINIPAIFISGFLFVSTGLAYDVFGTPRPDEYFVNSSLDIPILTTRMEARNELEGYIEGRAETAPEIENSLK